jgi:hypothetical protein
MRGLFALLTLVKFAFALLSLALRHVLLLRSMLGRVRFHDFAFPCLALAQFSLTQFSLAVCIDLLLLWGMSLLQRLRDTRQRVLRSLRHLMVLRNRSGFGRRGPLRRLVGRRVWGLSCQRRKRGEALVVGCGSI